MRKPYQSVHMFRLQNYSLYFSVGGVHDMMSTKFHYDLLKSV